MEMSAFTAAEPLLGSPPPPLRLFRRRLAFFALVAVTMLAAVAGLATVFLPGGLDAIELAMLVVFALNLPWIAIGLWNAVIGFVLLRRRGGLGRVVPLAGLDAQRLPLSERIAIVMPVHDEDPDGVFRALRTTIASLDATGGSTPFDVFLLSDTRDAHTAAHEVQLFAAWRSADARPERLHYRRRAENVGFKAGNLREFCERWGRDYESMIVLDADSVMSGAAILRLAGLMEANPRLGILQTLITGLPSQSPFARISQFGMRHGMRAYTVGSTWWQGDAGPYWGHNAIIRLRPFVEHCRLPRVPGAAPLGSEVLSHDQVEAVLMRWAGWDVRVLPIEDGSWEANPPTLLDFVKRDLRWCHGNMQYARLLSVAGDNRMGRLQMVLAILMYTSAPCWLGFYLLRLLQLLAQTAGAPPVLLLAEPRWLPGDGTMAAIGMALLVGVVGMTWAPKLLGLLQVLVEPALRRTYGGARRVLAGGAVELLFSMLLAPAVGTAQTVFLAGLLSGRRLKWASQARTERRVTLSQALRRLWPQAALGLLFLVSLLALMPAALCWASPLIAGLLLAIPFAVVTSSPRLGVRLARLRLCATPDELHPSPEVRAVCPWLAACPPRPADATLARGSAAASSAAVS